ncbi:hypothetical protein BKA81DRAFT_396307 [Phyllosticta paracitricarpa]|uniref:Uncharacterized protein n=1 Tax=Phyllosticta citricarpa TaxID=55181 RepID=A0ABR1MN51_9PEZI
MWTTFLFSQALLLICAVRGVIAAPAADPLDATCTAHTTSSPPFPAGGCLDYNPKSPLISFRVSGKFHCSAGKNPSGLSYEREMREEAMLTRKNSYWAAFYSCQNIEHAYNSNHDGSVVAEHYFGPLNVGGKKCCYTMVHQLDTTFESLLGLFVPFFNPATTTFSEGCSAPGGTACPPRDQQVLCTLQSEIEFEGCTIKDFDPKCRKLPTT